jgi:hypothetical protein
MFTPVRTFDNISDTLNHPLGLIICSKNAGTSIYRQDKLEPVHEANAWYACTFLDTVLLQQENGAGISWLKMQGDGFAAGEIEGALFLHTIRVDDRRIYIRSKPDMLHEFNSELEHVQSHRIGKTPYALYKGLYYRLYPHFTCFSLQTHDKVWEITNDDMLEKNTVRPDNYIALREDLLIARTKFTDNTNALIAYKAEDGSIAWQRGDYVPNMKFMRGCLQSFYYGAYPRTEGRLLMIDEKNGDIIQDVDVTGPFRELDARRGDHYLIAADDRYLYLAGSYGRAIYALNTSTYAIDWTYSFERRMRWLSDIKVQDNNLFVLDDLDTLHVFRRN